MKHLKKHVNDFGNDPVPSLVLRISIPFMFAQFVNVLYSIHRPHLHRKYSGNRRNLSGGSRGLRPDHHAAFLLQYSWVGIGGSVLFSMRMGQKDRQQAGRILG